MARSFYEVQKIAKDMYRNRDKYAYFYGAKGQVLTKPTMDALVEAEPKHFSKYSDAEMNQIYRNSLGKIGYDCSGFVCHVTGETGYSVEIYEKRTKESTLSDETPGSFLFTTWGGKSRHIGITTGCGEQLDMGWESTDANVAAGKDSVHLALVSEVGWEHLFQTAAVNYNGALAGDPNAGQKQYIYNGVDYTGEFDPYYYADHYDDLKKAFGYDEAKLLEHWVNYGKKENRTAKAGAVTPSEPAKYIWNGKDYASEFDPVYYADLYPDLKEAYGYDVQKLLLHWIVFGKKEGRVAKAGTEPAKKLGTVYNCGALNVRSGPGTKYAVQRFDLSDGRGVRTLLYPGEQVLILGESGNWYQIRLTGASGSWDAWVSKSYVKA